MKCEHSYRLAQPSTTARDGQMTVFKPGPSPAGCWLRLPMMPPEKLSQRNSTTTLTEMKGNGEETWERELVIARVAAVVVTPGPGHRAANINRNEADNLSSGSLTSAID